LSTAVSLTTERILGLDGDDNISGGNDKILGGDGDDTINATLGNDTVNGSDGDDLVRIAGNFVDATVTLDGDYYVITIGTTVTRVVNVDESATTDTWFRSPNGMATRTSSTMRRVPTSLQPVTAF
jgi:hypothetical protein